MYHKYQNMSQLITETICNITSWFIFRYCACFEQRVPLTFRQIQSVGSLWNRYVWHDKTYSQIHRTDKYSQHSSIIWSVWLNGWVFVYKLSGCGFEPCCSHLNFSYGTCFKQGVPSHSGKYMVWFHSETHYVTW